MAYDTTLELLQFLQEEVNDTAPEPATQARYLALLDRAHKAIVGGGGELNLDDRGSPMRRPVIFPWALSAQPKTITLLPFQEGSADVTQLSNSAVTCSIDSATTDMTGWHIRFEQLPTIYYISSHSGTTITLDCPYIDISSTATNFRAFKLIYTLGADDILLLTDKLRIYTQSNISSNIGLVGSNQMFDTYPLHRIINKVPDEAAVLKQTNGTFTIQFSSYPSEYKRVDARYVPKPATLLRSGSDPIIPNGSSHRVLLAHLAAYYQLRIRDDDRAISQLKTAKDLFDSLVTESLQNIDANDPAYGQIAPWSGGFDGNTESAFDSIVIEI